LAIVGSNPTLSASRYHRSSPLEHINRFKMKPHSFASIGLLSDTHYQERLFHLPDRLKDLWPGVELILHAGDVGDLRILDELGRIAPVVAVHGNDDPEDTHRILPEQQVLAIRGHRILLWHSHFADRSEEIRKRNDIWGEKFRRIASHARDAGADVVVYGHTHVPMVSRHEGTLLVNPGALASGSYFTRQVIPSAGRLELADGEESKAVLFDLRTGQARDFPAADPAEDFGRLGNTYQEWSAEPEMIPDLEKLRKIEFHDFRSVVRAIIPEYRRLHDTGLLRRENLMEAFQSAAGLDPTDREKIISALAGGNEPP
jgi:putative phosphoesterase